MQKLPHIHLLDFDDPGLGPLADTDRMNLLELIEDGHGSGSTIMTGQLRIGHWHETIGEPSIADGTLDRRFHDAYKIKLKGDFMLRPDGLGCTRCSGIDGGLALEQLYGMTRSQCTA